MGFKPFRRFQRVGGSSRYCCVPFCKASQRFNSVLSFHTIPVNKNIRNKWLRIIRREDLNITRNTRICGRHFKSEDVIQPLTPTGRRQLRKGAVPTLFQWNNYSIATPRREVFTSVNNDAVHLEHDYCFVIEPATSDLAEDLCKEEEEELSVDQSLCLGRFAASDDDILFYTRFLTYNHLMAFWRLIEPESHNMVRVTGARASTRSSEEAGTSNATCQYLQPIDEFFLFMVHLSVGLSLRDLAHRFNVHQSSVSEIIIRWASFLYTVLGSERIWMSGEAVKAHLPKEFQDYPDTQVVIDCLELRCETPFSLPHQSEDVFMYKSHYTFKGLIGIAPHGAVTFVSSLFAGSVSGNELLKRSGLLPLLKPEMAIMVDKGFLVDCVTCKIHRPAYFSKREMRSDDEVIETQSNAHLRVHVKRLIHRVKQHKMFDTVIPSSITGSINQLYTVACLLANYQNGPLIKASAKD